MFSQFSTRLHSVANRITTSRILRGSSAMMVSNIVSSGAFLLLSTVLGRKFGVDNYGLMILSMTIVKGVTSFLDVRSDDAIIKFMGDAIAKGEKHSAITYLYIGFLVDAAIMVVTLVTLLVGMPIIGIIYGNNPLLLALVKVFLISLPFSLLDNVFLTVLITFKRFTLGAVLSLVNNVIQVGCVIVLSTSGNIVITMWGYILAAMIIFAQQVGLCLLVLYRELGTFRGQGFRAAWHQFLPFVFHTNLIGYLKSITGNMDVLLLGVFRPPAEVGFYKIAKSAVGLMTIPTKPVSVVIYPNLNEAWAQNNSKRAQQLIWKFLLYTSGLCLIAIAGVFILANSVVILLYGPAFLPTADLMRILAISVGLGQLGLIIDPVLFAKGRPDYNTYMKLGLSVLRLALSVPFIFLWGAVGAGISSGITTFAGLIVFFIVIFPKLGIWNPKGYKKSDINSGLGESL